MSKWCSKTKHRVEWNEEDNPGFENWTQWSDINTEKNLNWNEDGIEKFNNLIGNVISSMDK